MDTKLPAFASSPVPMPPFPAAEALTLPPMLRPDARTAIAWSMSGFTVPGVAVL